MSNELKTLKMHFLGNDFVIFNLLGISDYQSILPQIQQKIALISDRRFGMGCDQLVIICPSQNNEEYQAEALFFNNDGSESSACGNATRCVTALIGIQGLRLKTKAGILDCYFDDQAQEVSVNMGQIKKDLKDVPIATQSYPKDNAKALAKIKIDICSLAYKKLNEAFAQKKGGFLSSDEAFPLSSLKYIIKDIDFFNFGNPHCVLEIDFSKFAEYFIERSYLKNKDKKEAKTLKIASNSMLQNKVFSSSIELDVSQNLKPHETGVAKDVLEAYETFTNVIGFVVENSISIFPQKTNVEFAQLVNDKEVFFTVWERGSGKTLACGTGACAVGSYFIEKGYVKNGVKVFMDGSIKFARLLKSSGGEGVNTDWKNNYIQITHTKEKDVIMTGGYSVAY